MIHDFEINSLKWHKENLLKARAAHIEYVDFLIEHFKIKEAASIKIEARIVEEPNDRP